MSAPEHTPRIVLDGLAAIDPATDVGLLVFADPPDEGLTVAAATPDDRLAAELRSVVSRAASRWHDRELVEYGPAADPGDGQLMWLPTERAPFLADLQIPDLADLPLVEFDAPYARHLILSAIRVMTAMGPAVFYRELRRGQLLARSPKIPVLRRGDRMTLADDRTLLLDRGTDAIVANGYAYFLNRKAFQRLFGLVEEMQERAAATFDLVTVGLEIDGFDEFREVATSAQPAMLGKMASIQQKLDQFPGYAEAITMSNLVAFIRQNPQTGVELSSDGDDARLVFRPDPQHRFKILKLLDDDYLESALTHLHYDANSKAALPTSGARGSDPG
jgi:hypothetical protein